MKDFRKYWDALTYTAIWHDDQKRKTLNIPYIIHPIRITAILRSFGFSEWENEDLMIAALLHDVIEDTEIHFNEIERRFGKKIAVVVNELSKPINLRKENWLKTFDEKSIEAKIIKMADRIDNLMDLTKLDWSDEKKRNYLEQGKIILEKCGKSNEDLANNLAELIQELEREF